MINDTIDKLCGLKFFSTINLISIYLQFLIENEDQQKYVFITLEGFYQPIQMPQKLANTPAMFQCLMENTFQSLKLSCVLVYLDNINNIPNFLIIIKI